MKKLIVGIISIILVVSSALGLTACGGDKETTSLKNWGAIKSVGGAIAETDNYLYYINGIGSSTESNEFGKSVKGSLMVVDKATLGTEEVKTEIVVPKLMVASDYQAGVYLFGSGEETYVYYATPSIEKDSSGSVASSDLTFMRTKLNGTGSEEFFTVNGLDTDYRMAEKDGVVYIVYYDAEEEALVSYNTSVKQATEIAKIDAETTTKTTLEGGAEVYLSLDSYRLIENGYGIQVSFIMTAYAENYFEDKAEDEGDEYERAKETFNLMYTYSIGDTKDAYGVYGKLLYSGEADDVTYALNLVEDGYLFYKATDLAGRAKDYAIDLNDASLNATLIKNADYVQDHIVIVSLDEVYYNDTEKLVVYKTTLTGDDTKIKETVITGDKVTTLLYSHDGFIYYHAKEGKIARYALNGEAREEIVSNDTASSTWYDPQIFEVNGVDYMFYVDTSTAGSSYLKYVNVDAEAVLDLGDDEESDSDDFYTLENQAFLGKMTEKDYANTAIAAIEAIPATDIEYEVTAEGKVVFTKVADARAKYDALSKEAKKAVSDTLVEKLENAERAEKLANYYYQLKDYKNYAKMSQAEKENFEQSYEEAKAFRQELIDEKDSVYTVIRDFITEDIKMMYQEAAKLLEVEE